MTLLESDVSNIFTGVEFTTVGQFVCGDPESFKYRATIKNSGVILEAKNLNKLCMILWEHIIEENKRMKKSLKTL